MLLDEILCGMKIDPSKQKDFLPVESRSFLALIGMLWSVLLWSCMHQSSFWARDLALRVRYWWGDENGTTVNSVSFVELSSIITSSAHYSHNVSKWSIKIVCNCGHRTWSVITDSGTAVLIVLIKTAVAFIFRPGEVLAEFVGNPAYYQCHHILFNNSLLSRPIKLDQNCNQ